MIIWFWQHMGIETVYHKMTNKKSPAGQFLARKAALFLSGFLFHPAGQGKGEPVRRHITPAFPFFSDLFLF